MYLNLAHVPLLKKITQTMEKEAVTNEPTDNTQWTTGKNQ